ncbi:MAG: dihydroorotase [Sulfobacillus sp.]
MRLVIKGGRLLDPGLGLDQVGDLVVEAGLITQVGGSQPADGGQVVEAQGQVVMPGLVDMHVHLRQPGQSAKETLETGLRAAVRGGFTALAAMPNTRPVIDQPALAVQIEQAAAALGLARVHQMGAISLGSGGELLADFAGYAQAGIRAVTDDGLPVGAGGLMRRALQHARATGLVVVTHSEDPSLAQGGVADDGPDAWRLGLPTQPASAEAAMVARDLVLAAETGARLHVAHVSTDATVQLIRTAKANGVAVTAEATPHHLLLTSAQLARLGTLAKMNPPLRQERDRQALIAGLADGTIDAVATDHAPHTGAEKAAGWLKAPFGVTGMETALPMLVAKLVEPGLIPLGRLIEAMSSAPAAILTLAPRTLSVGAVANLTLVDLSAAVTFSADGLATAGKNCPFLGERGLGRVLGVVVEGRWLPC